MKFKWSCFAHTVQVEGGRYTALLLVSIMAWAPPQASAVMIDCIADNDWNSSLFCALETSPIGSCAANKHQCEYTRPISPQAPAQTGKAYSARMLYSNPLAVPAATWDPATDLRCADGTEPFMYVDKGGAGSNDWVFNFSGGGSCSISGAAGSDSDCKQRYPGERLEFSSHGENRGKNLEGVMSHLPTKNPFSAFNRVKLDKCGFNRFSGRNTSTQALASDPTIEIQQSGFLTIGRMLSLLDTDAGNGGADFEDCSGQQCLPATLPRLCQPGPQKFVFAGHSDGAHGLINNIDNIVANLRQLSGCNDKDGEGKDLDEYYVVIDAQFLPMTENECKYDPAGCSGCPPGLSDSIYCHDSDGDDSDGLSWDDDYFSGTGIPGVSTFRQAQVDWGNGDIEAIQDQSCLDYHQTHGGKEKCADRFHVVANHLSTPFFLRESLADQNKEHFSDGLAHPMPWRNSVTGSGWNIDDWVLDPNTVFFLDEQAQYAQRVIEQANDMADPQHRQYADESPLPPFRIFLPACINHEGVAQNETFENMQISGLKYKQALWGFVNQAEQYPAKVWAQGNIAPRDCAIPAPDENLCFPVKLSNGQTSLICL